MIKFSELEEISASLLLANTTAIIPVTTGNATLDTYKANLSSIRQFVLANVDSINATNISVSSTLTGNDVVANSLSIAGNITSGNISVTSSIISDTNTVNVKITTANIETSALTVLSNVTAGNIASQSANVSSTLFANVINATGNVSAGNLTTSSNATIGNSFFTNKLLLGNSSTDAISSSNTTADPTKTVTTINTTGGPLSATLGSATTNGMIKTFHMVTDGGDLTLTVTNAGWNGGASGTITFDREGDGCILIFLSGRWFMIGNNGTVTT